MTIETRAVGYEIDGAEFEGILAYDPSWGEPRPLVLVSHAWAGRTDMEVAFARRVAEMGYAGFALDLYGKGVTGSSKEENQKLMTPFVKDRAMLQDRLKKILAIAKEQPESDAGKAAAIGFCFGGLCVLDMARSGADVRGVASFHGLLMPAENTKGEKIAAQVIAFHGWDDPMATPEDALAFARELTDAGADWRLHAYGGTMHAFTNPAADDPEFGTVYNEKSADRAWTALHNFLTEIFQD